MVLIFLVVEFCLGIISRQGKDRNDMIKKALLILEIKYYVDSDY